MPKDIQPLEVVAMLYYTIAHHPNSDFYLRERKPLTLHQMFIDAEEIEENLRACGKLPNQISDEDLNEYEEDKDYEQQKSDHGVHLFQNFDTSSSNLSYSVGIEISKSSFSFISDV